MTRKYLTFSIFACVLLALQAGSATASLMYVDSFPSASSTRSTASSNNFWNLGDYVEQAFLTTGLTEVNELSLDLVIDNNVLNGTDTQDMDVILNSAVIGSFMISSVDTLLNLSFTGLSVAGTGAGGDDYLLRLETTRTVVGGAGSAGIADGQSNLTLTQAQVPVPATLALLGLGLIGMGYKRHKQTKAA